MSEKILVLTGSGRSGTTLMAKALNEVYNYGIGAEPKNVKYIIDYAQRNDLSDEAVYKKLLDSCYKSQVLHRLRTIQKVETDYKDFVACIKTRSAEGMVLGLFRYVAKLRNRKFLGYKDPKDVTNISYIKQHVPGAYFIHVTRNGEDVAYSVNKFDWGPNNPVSGAVFWRRQIKKSLKDKHGIPEKDYLEIKLEDMETDMEGVSKRIDQFVASHTGVSDEQALFKYLQSEFRHSDTYKKAGLVYNMVKYIVRDCNTRLGYKSKEGKTTNLLYELLIPCFFLSDIPLIVYGRLRRKAGTN